MVDLVTLVEVKEHLDKTSGDDDAELMDFIEAVTPVVEDLAGIIIPRTFVERHPDGCKLSLFHMPVQSVTSVEPWLTIGTTYIPSSLRIDTEFGNVYRLDGMPFTGGPFKVTYVAGRGGVVPPNVRLASKIIIGHLWETQRGKLVRLPGAAGDQVRVPPGYAAPKHAQELLQANTAGPVVA